MAHIIRENAGKKTETISELFTNRIFEFTFVSIFADMTIHRLATLRTIENMLRTQSPALVPALFEFSLRLWILRFLNGQSGTCSQFHSITKDRRKVLKSGGGM